MPTTKSHRLGLAVAMLIAASAAQAESTKESFEKYGLLGTWAADCSQPASTGNGYYVHRALDANYVQRDFMIGPSTRQWVTVIDNIFQVRTSELRLIGKLSGTVGGQTYNNERTDGVWRIEPNRLRQLSAMVGGRPVITDGRLVANGNEMPWVHRCDAPAAAPVAQPASPPANANVVVAGAKTPVRRHSRFDDNCQSRQVAIRMLTPPAHGAVTSEPHSYPINAGMIRGSSMRCVGKTVDGILVFYQSSAGFTGHDHFRYLRHDPANANDPLNTEVDVTVVVR